MLNEDSSVFQNSSPPLTEQRGGALKLSVISVAKLGPPTFALAASHSVTNSVRLRWWSELVTFFGGDSPSVGGRVISLDVSETLHISL